MNFPSPTYKLSKNKKLLCTEVHDYDILWDGTGYGTPRSRYLTRVSSHEQGIDAERLNVDCQFPTPGSLSAQTMLERRTETAHQYWLKFGAWTPRDPNLGA